MTCSTEDDSLLVEENLETKQKQKNRKKRKKKISLEPSGVKDICEVETGGKMPELRAEANEEPKAPSPIIASFQDHFTLPIASNLIRFRNKQNAARVYESKGVQMVIEETYDDGRNTSEITVRRLEAESISLQFLRSLYTIVCALWTGFFMVFCLQFQLFLILELGIESGATHINGDVHVGAVLGVALALGVFVRAFSEALVIAGHYILDMWSGHFLAKQFILKNYSEVVIEWIFCTAFLLLPVLVMCITLLQQRDDWWETTAIVWFGCILAFYVMFCVNVVFYEVKAAYEFAKNMSDDGSNRFWDVMKRCISLKMCHTYGGKYRKTYLCEGAFHTTEDTESLDKSNIVEGTGGRSMGIWSKLTERMPDFLFTKLTNDKRLYTIEDVQDFRPFLTYNTWSLESFFCRPKNSRYIAIIKGPGRLTRAQLRSSMACTLLGTLLIILLVISFLVWFNSPGSFIALVVCICLLFAWSGSKNVLDIFKVGKNVLPTIEGGKKNSREEQEFDEEESEALYLVQECRRTTETTELANTVFFCLELAVFFIYPAVVLFIINWTTAIFFVVIAGISNLRSYVNVKVVIEETGDLSLVGGKTPKKNWEKQARLSDILNYVSASKSKEVWAGILGFVGLAFLAIFLSAVGSSTESQGDKTWGFLPNAYYPPQLDDVRYPTCSINKLQSGFDANATLADYTFLAQTAYLPDDLTQISLDAWFGEGIAEDRQDIVGDFRSREDPDSTPVVFKLVTFPSKRLAVVMIRGTTTSWDMLADAQLWSAASLMQGLRAILPAGEIWSPIFNRLVFWINSIQAESVEKVSFYRLTTKFAKELKEDPRFDHVHVTGHSLGGGLSMITGAQAKVPAIGVSGPNALISGRSFDPPVTKEDMNRYTLNIIPDRDIVPMLDDAADQIQNIRCEASSYDLFGCHLPKRALCEILYTCGSGPRPVLCECFRDYGYPKPEIVGDEDIDEICGLD